MTFDLIAGFGQKTGIKSWQPKIDYSYLSNLITLKTDFTIRLLDSLEEFYSAALIIGVPDFSCSADVGVALDDDGQEGAEHDNRLERVGPHDGLDPSLQTTTKTALNPCC